MVIISATILWMMLGTSEGSCKGIYIVALRKQWETGSTVRCKF